MEEKTISNPARIRVERGLGRLADRAVPLARERHSGLKDRIPVKPPSPQRRNPRTHRAVIAAAEDLLAEVGYAGVSIDQIAERAAVSKATVYRWWPNKAAVFIELYLSIVKENIRPPVDTGSLQGDVREQIRMAFRIFRTTVAGLALAGFVADAQSNPVTRNMLQEGFANDILAINMSILGRAALRGELSTEISAEVAAELISGAIYYQLLVRGREFTDAEADKIAQVVLRGIAAPETQKKSRKILTRT